MKKTSLILLILTLLVSCTKAVVNKTDFKIDKKSAQFTNTAKDSLNKNMSEKFLFSLGDSIKVEIEKNPSPKKINFDVNLKNKNFKGTANLVLLEDDGKFYLPEGTAIPDDNDNTEYFCDSTFAYNSEKINFTFAIENKTKKRLSFIVSRSTIKEIHNNFYTLYNENYKK